MIVCKRCRKSALNDIACGIECINCLLSDIQEIPRIPADVVQAGAEVKRQYMKESIALIIASINDSPGDEG